MTDRNDHGGEESLAPVISLFTRTPRATDPRGDASAADAGAAVGSGTPDADAITRAVESDLPGIGAPEATTDPDGWWVDPQQPATPPSSASGRSGVGSSAQRPVRAGPDAPVLSLRDARAARGGDDERSARDRHPAGVERIPGLRRASELAADADADAPVPLTPARGAGVTPVPKNERPRLRAVAFLSDSDADGGSVADVDASAADRERGETALVKRLRGRGMSVAEARTFLRGMDVVAADIDAVVDDFVARGYLDDAMLADQLVHAAVSRKGQGRRAISQALGARGIERSVIDAVLADLPDDDEDRALDYARTKAPALARLEPAVALRRLVGQLSRRGFPGSIAMSAAKEALAEQSGPRFR